MYNDPPIYSGMTKYWWECGCLHSSQENQYSEWWYYHSVHRLLCHIHCWCETYNPESDYCHMHQPMFCCPECGYGILSAYPVNHLQQLSAVLSDPMQTLSLRLYWQSRFLQADRQLFQLFRPLLLCNSQQIPLSRHNWVWTFAPLLPYRQLLKTC